MKTTLVTHEFKGLNFDRFNLHIVGKNVADEIEKTKELIETETKKSQPSTTQLKFWYKQVGVYYAYYIRDKILARKFLDKYLELTVEGTQENADAHNLVGYANTMDGAYKDATHFETALATYRQLKQTRLDPDTLRAVELEEAVTLRYIGLLHHRNRNTQLAQKKLEEAISIHQKYQESFPPAVIDLAESTHILGVILGAQNKHEAELKQLDESLRLTGLFCQRTQSPHFMRFITMQSRAKALLNFNRDEEALAVIKETRDAQVQFCGTETHVDVAKTLHFMGDIYLKMKKYNEAYQAYAKAFAIKWQLFNSGHLDIFLVNVTKLAIHNLLQAVNRDFNFDWNDHRTIKPNEFMVVLLEPTVSEISSLLEHFGPEAKQELGRLSFKLGAYYLHVKRDPIQALKYLSIADKVLIGDEAFWVLNHIAFSYQQKLFKEKENKEQNARSALQYCEQVLAHCEVYENTAAHPKPAPLVVNRIKLLAFAHCLNALIAYETQQLDQAVLHYRHALDIYEKHGLLDDQYARAKNRYAQFLVEQNKIAEATTIFEEIEKYWTQPKNNQAQNPYAARFYVSYAGFLEKNCGNRKLALVKYEIANRILCTTDGKDAGFTKDIQKKIAELTHDLFWKNAKLGGILVTGLAFLGIKFAMTTINKTHTPTPKP